MTLVTFSQVRTFHLAPAPGEGFAQEELLIYFKVLMKIIRLKTLISFC